VSELLPVLKPRGWFFVEPKVDHGETEVHARGFKPEAVKLITEQAVKVAPTSQHLGCSSDEPPLKPVRRAFLFFWCERMVLRVWTILRQRHYSNRGRCVSVERIRLSSGMTQFLK
jgi:hypothetical protein